MQEHIDEKDKIKLLRKSPVDPLFKIEMMTDKKFLNFYQEKFELKRAQISPLYFNDTDKDLLNK